MGRNSKKKKRGGGVSARRSKGQLPSKDHGARPADDNDIISEEITALCAIFQEDCKVISDSPPQIVINLRPYSKDTGYEDLDISALLSVRFLPGYPYKCPKLQITPETGLSKGDAGNLLALLHDQANSNAREGRVMIFNLVEAAQEFLSEIVPIGSIHESVPRLSVECGGELQKDMSASCKSSFSSKGPFVYGFKDLFSGSGDWHMALGMDDLLKLDRKSNYEVLEKKFDQNAKPLTVQDNRQGQFLLSTTKLATLQEETEGDNKSTSPTYSNISITEEMVEKEITGGNEDLYLEKKHISDAEDAYLESESSGSLSSSSMVHDQSSQTIEKDLVMIHLLHLACSSKAPLADALPEITSELYNLGIFSESTRDLANKPLPIFNKTFDHVFRKHMVTSRNSPFWELTSDLRGQNASSLPNSRYLNDFEELQSLGHGGFGHVVLCKNKLDGRQYAVKKIRLKDKSPPLNDRILREVATLSRLQHQHVVRYYQAWFETGVIDSYVDSIWGSRTAESSGFSYKEASQADGHENKLESTYLYIQMEYCPRTLREMFDSYSHFDKDLAWHLFRQIVEGLVHIHGQGIIHRDLTPSNIFFDARNDIKIGDFGLAKFLTLEQLEQDSAFLTDTGGVSVDVTGTGQVGTYFYTAPEIEQGWPKIDEKADMYSLGVVFFELWHPFGTAMERHVILSELKQKGELPASWVSEFPEQTSLLKRLMSSIPSDRPSATELLQHAFPPRMEFELVDNILRTMQSSEDSSIYDKVVNAIFDEEMLSREVIDHQHDTSSIQYADLNTEVRDHIVNVTREMFRRHCAKHLEITPMRLLTDCPQFNRNTVKLLTHGGDIIELCHELRLPFAYWVITNQKSSFRRYEISGVYRRAIGRSPPNRFLQGDFDIVGGTVALTEAEVIKASMDVLTHLFHEDSCDIHLNHADLMDAIWSWIGIKAEQIQKVAELLSMMGSLRPQSSQRKSKWVVIRRQLLQQLNLGEAVVNRLQTVGLRFCGEADQALPRLRGALPSDNKTRKALDELSDLFSYLRVWRIEKHVFVDVLMPPTEFYHRQLFFQIYLLKENHTGSLIEGTLLAIGGRYDYMLHQMWEHEYKSNPPGAVGTSLALETIIRHSTLDFKPLRNEVAITVLVCSRGGGGLLQERMELVSDLWEENIKAEFVPLSDPSLTEQYEYANEHDIKCLVIITDTGVSQTDSVKVRHIDLKKEKEVERGNLVKFLLDAMATQFRNPSIWN